MDNNSKPVYAREGLYRVDTFTDTHIADIKMLVPVRTDGTPDITRDAIFVSTCTAKLNGQLIPVTFRIPAATLEEACAKVIEEGEKETAKVIEKANQQRAQPRLMVPPGIVPPTTQ